MRHRLEGDAVAGGFALGLALLGVFDALDAQLAPVLAHVAETVGQRYVIVLGIAISTAAIGLTERAIGLTERAIGLTERAIGLTERAIGHLGDAQLEQSEQLTQRFRYGLIALIGGLGQALDAATKRVGVLGIDLEPGDQRLAHGLVIEVGKKNSAVAAS